VEFTRGYSLENDEKEFSDRREKVYTFMKIPLEVERFMFYGFCQVCAPKLFYHNYNMSTLYFTILVCRFIPICLYIPTVTGVSRIKIFNLSFNIKIQVSILLHHTN